MTAIEHVFEHGRMANLATVRQLQDRIAGMQAGVPRLPIATPPALADLVQLRTGGAYEVDNATLALTLLAGASRALIFGVRKESGCRRSR